MCYQLTELYSACKCLYYQHAIDRCPSFGQTGHGIEVRTILVGYYCSEHTAPSATYGSQYNLSDDSGYYSSNSRSSRSYK